MGLSFISARPRGNNSSRSVTSEWLTPENTSFLKQLGFKVKENGCTGYSPRACFRRDTVGERVSHPQSLRFIEIGKQ